jgi:hypothetical protein
MAFGCWLREHKAKLLYAVRMAGSFLSGNGRPSADSAHVAYICDHWTLLKCVVIDRFQENRDLEDISDVMTVEGRIRRSGLTDDSDPFATRVHIPEYMLMVHFFKERVSKTTIRHRFLAEYVVMYSAYDNEEQRETEELAVDGIQYDSESIRRAMANIKGKMAAQ